jgi:hypothetical protein
MLTIITPTGGRPQAFAMLAGYINAQTHTGDIRWIVVDDCRPLTPVPQMRPGIVVEKLVPEWVWQPGMNTQAACMALALESVTPGNTVLVFEDDDAYLPGHIESTLKALVNAELTGERVSRYYNVDTRKCREIPGQWHASLSSVGCRGSALALLKSICEAGSRRIDMDLWQQFQGPKTLTENRNVVGIKGLSGRAGIGIGHRSHFGDPDPDGKTLIEWLGAERAAKYLEDAWR